MFAREDGRLGRQARLLRLNTLLGLRWFAIAGQTAAILIGAFVFGLRFPVLACLGLVGASAALNLALRWRFPVSIRLSERGATIMLGYDILQLAGLLFLTGGVANPFVLFFLAPVTIAATSLTFRQALALLGLAIVCATALLRASLPMPWLAGENLTLPPLYVFGLWTAFAASAGFVAFYAYRVAEEARQNASALTATELVLARAHHLSQIDGLAAAAAHELGTPLATVALVVREWADHPPAVKGFADDLALLEQSVDKCRTILGKLSEPAALTGQRQMDISSPMELAEIAAAPHRLLGVAIAVLRKTTFGASPGAARSLLLDLPLDIYPRLVAQGPRAGGQPDEPRRCSRDLAQRHHRAVRPLCGRRPGRVGLLPVAPAEPDHGGRGGTQADQGHLPRRHADHGAILPRLQAA